MKTTPALLRADSVGACLSVACAIHCAAAPLLFSLFALWGADLLLGERIETIFLASTITLASITHWLGFKAHQRQLIFLGPLSAIILIVLGKFYIRNQFEIIFVVLGGTILSVSHFINRYFCKKCPECQHH